VITFINDFTSFAWTICLKSKDTAIFATKHFVTMVQVQFWTNVTKWMSDAGGEYTSKAFIKFLKDNGIGILQSMLHTPQQNGHAERYMHTFMDEAESMCFDACLPESWWEFAIEHATHVYNRTPTQHLNWSTLFQILYNDIPRVDHLRVFGCGTHVHIPANV
jgi:transposase InsO family protein